MAGHNLSSSGAKILLSKKEKVNRLFPIYFYRRHLDLAARDLLGLDLAPHHRLILRDWGKNKSINLVFASRGIGKTILLAIYYVLMGILYPHLKMIVAAGVGFRGSKTFMFECERVIIGSLSGQRQVRYAKMSLLDPNKVINKDPAFWTITFVNGSIISGVPLGLTSTGDALRGLRAHLLGQDEAFLIPSKLHQASLEPMQNVLYAPNKPADQQPFRNMSIMVSTCDFNFRDFYRQYEYLLSILESDQSDSLSTDRVNKCDISLFNFDIDDTYYIVKGKKKTTWGMDYDKIMKKRTLPTTDLLIWLAENKNQVMDISGGYYSLHDIEIGMNASLDGRHELLPECIDSCSAQCILGIDSAASDDNTAFVVIKCGELNHSSFDPTACAVADLGNPCPFFADGKFCKYASKVAVVYAYEENKMSQRNRIAKIYELLDRYNIVSIACDSRGGGIELADLLKDTGFVHEAVNKNVKPIYDPTRDNISNAMPLLSLYTVTQDLNLEFNGFMKGLISSQRMIFPKTLHERPNNQRIFEAAGHIETLVNQIVRIKAIPSGRSVSFIIESVDPETGRRMNGKKDIYSASLYAVGKLKELLDVKLHAQSHNTVFARPVAFKL